MKKINKWPLIPEKKKVNWQPFEILLCVTIAFIGVFGGAYYYFPFYEWMSEVDKQATAWILLGFFCGCYGFVWLINRARS